MPAWTRPQSTTCSWAAPTKPEKTTATWRGWRCCSPACPTACRASPSTASAAREWTPSCKRRAAIKAGEIELAMAGGVESMSRAPFVMPKAESPFARRAEIFDTTIGWRFVNPLLNGSTASTRCRRRRKTWPRSSPCRARDQDAFALRSQQRASTAQRSGRFDAEIVAVESAARRRAEQRARGRTRAPRCDPRIAGQTSRPRSARAAR